MMMMMMMTTMRAAGAEEETIDRGDHDCYSDHLDFDDYLDYDDGDTPQQDLHQPAAARQNKSDHYHTPRWGGFSPLAMKSRFVSQLLGSAKFYHHHHHHHYDDDEENRQKEPLLLPLYRRNHHLGLNVKAKNGWKDIGPGLRVMPVDEQQQQQQQDKVYGRSRRRRRRGGGTEVNGGRRQAKFFWVKAFLLSLVLLLVLAFLGHFAWKAVGVTRSSITARLWSSGKTATTCSDDAGPKFCHSVTDINI
ncbi:hypothetical protein QBC42DRAFT_271375 [Cladorrhinum samala]|uniref:Uncharacterized protein n=1 Tax=Cladorrhinum samala TaxID=585594 RepID=A0AAV9HJB9_9PEZI|nr:hypothetical protein QBC42DRAFT_271375 [Cladorrhinum samala]